MASNGFGIGRFFFVLALLIASLSLFAGQAQAHGGGSHDQVVDMAQSLHDDHGVKGHPGHCHGGTFCSGLAVVADGYSSPQPDMKVDRYTIVAAVMPVQAVTFFDPPPPRFLF